MPSDSEKHRGPSKNPEFGKRFGQNLKKIRQTRGLSQEELGLKADLHRTEVGMLERGIRLPRVDSLVKLTGSLPCSFDDLLKGLEWDPRSISNGEFLIDVDEDEPSQE